MTMVTMVNNNGSVARVLAPALIHENLLVYRLLFNIAVSVELADVSP
jgi:hypothetical protein